MLVSYDKQKVKKWCQNPLIATRRHYIAMESNEVGKKNCRPCAEKVMKYLTLW